MSCPATHFRFLKKNEIGLVLPQALYRKCEALALCPTFIPDKVFSKSFCRSQLPHKSIKFSFTITDTKNQLTDLCVNQLLQKTLEKHFV